MEIDQLILENSRGKCVVYPLATVNSNNDTYVYYSKEIKKNYKIEDIYVGKLIDNHLDPVENEKMEYLENKLKKFFSNKNNNN